MVIDDTSSSATSLDISDVGFSGFVISSFGGLILVVGESVGSVVIGRVVVVGFKDVVVVFGKVVNGVGKKGLKVVVGAREVCGGSTIITNWFIVSVVEGATVSTTVVIIVTSITGTVVVGAIVVAVVVGGVDSVIGGHDGSSGSVVVGNMMGIVVVGASVDVDTTTSVVIVVFVSDIVVVGGLSCIPLYDNTCCMLQTFTSVSVPDTGVEPVYGCL